jgi:hypothetical protein
MPTTELKPGLTVEHRGRTGIVICPTILDADNTTVAFEADARNVARRYDVPTNELTIAAIQPSIGPERAKQLAREAANLLYELDYNTQQDEHTDTDAVWQTVYAVQALLTKIAVQLSTNAISISPAAWEDMGNGERYLAPITINDVPMHLEAWPVYNRRTEYGCQQSALAHDDEFQSIYQGVAADGPLCTTDVNGKDCVLIASPQCQ